METAAETLSGALGEIGRGADAAAAHRSTDDFQAVASAAETLTGIVAEVGRHATRSAEGAAHALSGTELASARVRQLADAAREIGIVADSISEAAMQTNVLALGATVEASRSEGAGPGPGLVANRINDLANQTTQAAERITARVGEIHRAAEDALDAVTSLAGTVAVIDDNAGALAAAVDRQRHTALDIARNVHRAAADAREASENVTAAAAAVGRAAGEAGRMADTARGASRHAAGLRAAVESVAGTLRAEG